MSDMTSQQRAQELLDLLDLEAVEQNLFLGNNESNNAANGADGESVQRKALFGGQVMAQSLRAACRTVEGETPRKPHSLHGYFMRAGDTQRPVLYEVERIRDGRSFATRRVVAIQNGEAIFNLDASFQIDEEGMEHADAIPNAPRPRDLENDLDRVQAMLKAGTKDPRLSPMAARPRPFELRSVFPVGSDVWREDRYWHPVWMKFQADVDPADQALSRSVLTYASDLGLVGAAPLPHQSTLPRGNMQIMSLDHAMWIHRDLDLSQWLLYHRTTTWAGSARALCHGSFFNKAGDLVASVSQEGLMRLPKG